jgi:hypothetical protein
MTRWPSAGRGAYLRDYRADPLAAAVHRRSSRTINQARRELARRHRGEYAQILYEIRESDPKPEASEPREADDHAA